MKFNFEEDTPGTLRYWGSRQAELFTKEVEESYKGVLALNYVSEPNDDFPPGFLHASPEGQYWSGTMWTRDAGAFLRELVLWGHYGRACLTSQCLINLVSKNPSGFYTFPEYFRGYKERSAFEIGDNHTYPLPTSESHELDGTASIVIAMILLWQALPGPHEFRNRIYDFLHQPSSPLRHIHEELRHAPLVAGAGEFGGGAVRGLFYNVVQNNLAMMALLAAAEMEAEAGDDHTAALYIEDAEKIRSNMVKYLVDQDGAWMWCIDPGTLKSDPAVDNYPDLRGGSQINGVASMWADVLGLEPLESAWEGVEVGVRTFEKQYAFPRRKEQFDRYGIWLQGEEVNHSSPSYGTGYALQAMLLFDRLEMADKALSWLANTTYAAEELGVIFDTFAVGRRSPYYFYERYPSPEAGGERLDWVAGCGPLNLVCASEPLKVARLIMGVDDTRLSETKIIPRVPPSWKGAEAKNWPIRTSRGVVRADISFEKQDEGVRFAIRVNRGESISDLSIRLPSERGVMWHKGTDVTEFTV